MTTEKDEQETSEDEYEIKIVRKDSAKKSIDYDKRSSFNNSKLTREDLQSIRYNIFLFNSKIRDRDSTRCRYDDDSKNKDKLINIIK